MEVSNPTVLEQFVRRDLAAYEGETTVELLRPVEPGRQVPEVKNQAAGVLSELGISLTAPPSFARLVGC